MKGSFDRYINEVHSVLEQIVITGENGAEIERNEAFEQIAVMLRQIKEADGSVFFAGNGASCSMAEHMSHDFFQNAGINTRTCAETSHITAISNDSSFDEVFAFKIRRVLKRGDMLVTISSSGSSPNIIRAIEAARENGALVITLSGMKEGNKSRKMGDFNIYVPGRTYGLAESAHATILHALLDCFLDKYEGGRH